MALKNISVGDLAKKNEKSQQKRDAEKAVKAPKGTE